MSVNAEIVQDPVLDEPGWARLLAPLPQQHGDDAVQVCFRRNANPPWLGDGEWSDSPVWHPLSCANRADGRVQITVAPMLNQKLVNTTIEVSIESADSEAPAKYRLYWHVPVLAGAAQAGAIHEPAMTVARDEAAQEVAQSDAVPSAQEDTVADEPIETHVLPAQEAEEVAPDDIPPAAPPTVRSSGNPWKRLLLWGAAMALIAALAVAAWWWYLGGDVLGTANQAPATAAATPATSTVSCNNQAIKAWLDGEAPKAAAIRQLAKRCQLAAGGSDIAKRLYRRAARDNDSEAALVVARWFDPETFEAEGRQVSRPDAQSAARYYKIAADAGNPQAQYRYGVLLYEGATDAETGPEQGIEFIKRAAEAGHPEAAAFLDNQRKSQ